jgi:hypothetical protein
LRPFFSNLMVLMLSVEDVFLQWVPLRLKTSWPRWGTTGDRISRDSSASVELVVQLVFGRLLMTAPTQKNDAACVTFHVPVYCVRRVHHDVHEAGSSTPV